jgi:hypothetical protein
MELVKQDYTKLTNKQLVQLLIFFKKDCEVYERALKDELNKRYNKKELNKEDFNTFYNGVKLSYRKDYEKETRKIEYNYLLNDLVNDKIITRELLDKYIEKHTSTTKTLINGGISLTSIGSLNFYLQAHGQPTIDLNNFNLEYKETLIDLGNNEIDGGDLGE